MYISLLVLHHLVLEGQPHLDKKKESRQKFPGIPYTITSLKSRNRLVHALTPLDTNPLAERLRAWIHHLLSVPQKLKSIPSADLGPGSEAPWVHWKCLNRLRTGMVRCELNMLKWKCSYADIICDCGEHTQTMDHLLKSPMLPQECTTEDLLEYNNTTKECVFQWIKNV